MTKHSQSVGQHWGRRKRRAIKLSLILVSLLAGLLVAEIALRVVGYTFPTFYTTDDSRGYRLQPGMRGWYRKEGESYVQINSDGLRDREHSRRKPPDTFRVALLGDSYAEALQVPADAAFWRVLEANLRACPAVGGREVEVINFGVSGYGTAQELLTLRGKVWDYAPDLVMLAVTTNNDITDNSRALKRTDEVPYFVFRDGRLALDDSFRDSRAFQLRSSPLSRLGAWIRDSSRVAQALHQTQYAIKNYLALRRARKAATAGAPQIVTNVKANAAADRDAATDRVARWDEIGLDNLIYREPLDDTWQDAWRVTEALVVEMRDEVSARGARFVVVTLSNGIQVHPEPAAREAFMRRAGATDLFYPDKRIESLGARGGFTVLTLAPELQLYAERNHVFLHGFGEELGNGHWNVEGHRVAGEVLTRRLCESLSP
ncbi:MAG: SGNH/GDSL hydrolase family protein [Acidobacteria bacterium]|nr:SGNH/GDSL hydrolase family protein [Acidobacteriota bacterium]MCA1641670.1 SGNH/GDSL hydrolase family protein [Acidobacteriota bacterium]